MYSYNIDSCPYVTLSSVGGPHRTGVEQKTPVPEVTDSVEPKVLKQSSISSRLHEYQ